MLDAPVRSQPQAVQARTKEELEQLKQQMHDFKDSQVRGGH